MDIIPFSIVVELNCVLFSLLLIFYSLWRYLGRKEKGVLYLILAFTFLTSSATIQLIASLLWYYGIYVNIPTSRLLELSALAMFALFTITTKIALRKILQQH